MTTATIDVDELDPVREASEILRLSRELGLLPDTVVPVAGRRRNLVADADMRALLAARVSVQVARNEMKAAVLRARANGGSLREVAKAADVTASTVQRWENEAKA